MFQHVKLLAGVLHLLSQALVVLGKRVRLRGEVVYALAPSFYVRRLLGERGVSFPQRRLPLADRGQPLGARLQISRYAPAQSLSHRGNALFLPRDCLRERRLPRVETALFGQRAVQPAEFRLRRLERVVAREYLRRVLDGGLICGYALLVRAHLPL